MELRDVCDTGDTVFALLAVSVITGKSLRAASLVAMGAAGRQVGAVGITSWRETSDEFG
jgi:bifunctional ADP-heptose synthase (sugar kinase/adenylyltransferase)